jgi:hypothetical protein
MNPEHKESAEEYLQSKTLENWDNFGTPIKEGYFLEVDDAREYAKRLVKEAREQDIKEILQAYEVEKYQDEKWANGLKYSVRILKSKLEGGE